MKYSFLFLLLCVGVYTGQAQSYNLSSVPEALKKNAAVIVHLDNTNVEVEDIDKATVKVQRIFTVMNEEGKDALLFQESCNKWRLLDDAEIKVYDQTGRQTAKYKKKEMQTQAYGEGLVDDGYVTYYPVPVSSYPVTVEFDYELKLKSILWLPKYRFIDSKEAVIESNYSIKFPVDINIRYKAKSTSITPQFTEDGKYKIYKWTVKNLAAVEDEEGAVSERTRFPFINIVADQFSFYGNKGDLSSWKNFGAWMNQLYQGLDELPSDRQQFFQQLVKDAPSDEEKMKRIYHYLQENFRYVSIQLGIGGLKPFSASFTDQKKYGDCKALSNYMKAALKAIGIKSYVAIINAEYNVEPVDVDFPANDFNHVILCVPRPKDSLWLECTSPTAEFGKLGTFTENRNALLVTEEGGVLVPTPQSKASDNVLISHTIVTMDNDFSGTVETILMSTGEFDELINELLKDKKDDQKAFMVHSMGYKEPDDFLLDANESQENHQAKMMMTLRKVHDFNAGNKYFISPRMNQVSPGKLPAAENRKLDFYFVFPFEQKDTTVIKFPSNYRPDVLPNEKALTTNYSSYHSKSWYNEKENAVYTTTALILKKHKVAAADYAAVKNFFDEIAKDEAQKIVIKKTEDKAEEKKAF